MASSGIEPATFRLVAYCLKQIHYCVPLKLKYGLNIVTRRAHITILEMFRPVPHSTYFILNKTREVHFFHIKQLHNHSVEVLLTTQVSTLN
jgi:hypothetical protein